MRKLLVVGLLVMCMVFVRCATVYEPANPKAFGRTWELVGLGTENLQAFCDPNTISYSYHIVKFEYRSVDQLGYEHLGWHEIDCARNEFRIFNSTVYDKYYRIVGTPRDEPWQSIPPNSLIELFKKKYCR